MFEVIGSTWMESLRQFKWSELKMLFLVSLKSSTSAIRSIFRCFWWLLALVIPFTMVLGVKFGEIKSDFYYGGISISGSGEDSINSASLLKINLVLLLLSCFLIFVSFLALRPSLERKKIYYYLTYLRYFLGFIIISLLFAIIPPWLGIFFIPVFLFYLDSRGRLKDIFHSIIRGIKLTAYFLPFFFIMPFILIIPVIVLFLAFFLIIGTLFFFFGSKLGFFVFLAPSFILISFVIVSSFFVNYYSKIKHAHYQLFFKK